MKTTIPFTKMVGTGNDFVVVDTSRHPLPSLKGQWSAVSKALCDRHTGVGADGVLVLERSRVADVRMRVFNPDGSEAEMCGNGARCVALYRSQQTAASTVKIETLAGALEATVRGTRVAMRMTDPVNIRLDFSVDLCGRPIRMSTVDTGVPHAVVPVDAINHVDVARDGRALRLHQAFAPRGTNVNFIQADPGRPNRLRIRTYERGVEEETLACGTGIAAAAVVHGLKIGNGRSHRRRLEVRPRSGDVLTVSFAVSHRGSIPHITDLVLEGAAARVFDGMMKWPMRRRV